jgi:hypothetical protein
LTPAERKAAANAIWLCNNCGRLVDNDVSTYTVDALKKWKADAIGRAQQALASGGRSSSESLIAAHVREQQRSAFSAMYLNFFVVYRPARSVGRNRC